MQERFRLTALAATMMLALVPAIGQAEETGQIKNTNKISADDLIVTGDICANNDGQTYDVSAPNITVGNKALGVWVAGGSTLNVMTGVDMIFTVFRKLQDPASLLNALSKMVCLSLIHIYFLLND